MQATRIAALADAIVIGAGPCGLAAARELALHGAGTIVLERSDAVGGLCRTHRQEGFSYDLGGHRFFTRDAEVFDLIRSLLGDRLHVVERRSTIRIGDRRYAYPLELRAVLRGEGPLRVARILSSFVGSRIASFCRGNTSSDEGFDDWVRRNFGSELYGSFFAAYTEKLWGIPPSSLSAEWAARRIPRISMFSVARRALGLERRSPRSFAKKFCYPRRGIGEIFDALAKDAESRGVTILTKTRPTSLRKTARGWIIEIDHDGERSELEATRVISTMPIDELVQLVPGGAEIARCHPPLRYRSLRFLNLALEGRAISSDTWIYVPEAQHLMTRIQIPANRSPENCPPGCTSVQLEIPCREGDEIWTLPHEQLLERGLAALERLGFDVRPRVLSSFDTRASHAYPVYERGFRQSRDALLAWIESRAGLSTHGRQGRFDYMFFDRAIREGIDAARAALGLFVQTRIDDADPLLPDESRSTIESLPLGELGRSDCTSSPTSDSGLARE
jgi:protoporphyrinogen oxidase